MLQGGRQVPVLRERSTDDRMVHTQQVALGLKQRNREFVFMCHDLLVFGHEQRCQHNPPDIVKHACRESGFTVEHELRGHIASANRGGKRMAPKPARVSGQAAKCGELPGHARCDDHRFQRLRAQNKCSMMQTGDTSRHTVKS
jgi:hypothetical protein